MSGANDALAHLNNRPRLVTAGALALITLLCWLYILHLAAGMKMSASSLARAEISPWSLTEALLMFVMWLVMMVAMMLPSAAPMVLLFAAIRSRQGAAPQHGDVPAFLGGYVAVWAVFSALATATQAGLEAVAVMLPMTMTLPPALGGAVLISAGFYQLTPAKRACLMHCRAPVQFLSAHWRTGWDGAFRMGVVHGAYCLGCCWSLMLLLFVFGVMNLLWIAGLSLFVLTEKLLPRGDLLGRIAAPFLIAGGATMIALA